MTQRSMVRIMTLVALLGSIGGVATAALAEDNNPVTVLAQFPARDLKTARLGAKQVRFFAEVLTDSLGVDVISITRNTEFNYQALVACTGGVNGFIDQNGDSPLSPADDAKFICPPFTRGAEMMGGLAITN